jgi:hypothetical protein
MSLILRFNANKFKDQQVADAVRALLALEGKFTDKRQGSTLQGHLVSLSTVFPQEQEAIASLLGARPIVQAKGKTGKFVAVHRGANGAKVSDPGCTTCGDDKSVGGSENTTAPATEITMSVLQTKTPEEIATVFSEDVEKIKSFMQAADIDGGKASTAVGLARKIHEAIAETGASEPTTDNANYAEMEAEAIKELFNNDVDEIYAEAEAIGVELQEGWNIDDIIEAMRTL